MPNDAKRVAFVVNALTGKELTAGNRDSSRIYTVLTDPDLGMCSPAASPPPLHGCRTASKFSDHLVKVLGSWSSNDQLLLYFSGHGIVRNGIFCLQFGALRRTYLPFQNISNELRSSGVTRAVLILDACHSGGALRKGGSAAEVPLRFPQDLPNGIVVVASSRASQPSYELADGSASVFTKLLCDGMETGLGGKTTGDGYISVGDLVDYVRGSLRTLPYSQFPQEPMYEINEANREIWIAKNISGSSGSARTAQTSGVPEVLKISNIDELRIAYEHVAQARHPCTGTTMADLDPVLVREYADSAGIDFEGDITRQLVAQIGLFSPLSMGSPRALHNAAVLCFCESPEKFIPQARSTFLAGELGGDRFVQQQVTGPLSIQVEQLVGLTMEHLARTSSFGHGGLRRDEAEIPESVVRELVSNALAHRDYQAAGTVQVWVNAKALEVQSPGSFPAGTSWRTFLEGGRVSYPVDPAIALYLTRLLAVEGIGRGFSVFREYLEEGSERSMSCLELPGPTTLIRTLRTELMRRRSKLLKILFLSANPSTTQRLRLDNEVREIEGKLRASENRDAFLLVSEWAASMSDLQGALLMHKPDIVHFSFFDKGSTEILLGEGLGGHREASGRALAYLFRVLKDNIRLVFLNGGYSRTQAEAIAQEIDCVVGVSEAVGEEAATVFAASFYHILSFGRSVADAFDLSLNQLNLVGFEENSIPKLLVRQGVDAHQITFSSI